MTQSISCSIILGANHAGLADLRAQLYDTAGATVGAAVATGFFVVGNSANGNYGWTGNVADDFQGFINFYSLATPTIAAVVAVNQLPIPSASGANTVVVTIQDAGTSDTLADILVTVKDSGDTTLIDQKRTENDGTVTFSLDSDTYKVHVSPRYGYSSLAAQALVVDGNETQTYELDPIAVGTPSAPDLCRVYGFEYLNGNPVEDRTVAFQLMNVPQTTNNLILESTSQSAVSDGDGYWHCDLIIGKTYLITISEAGIVKALNVPNQATYNLASAF